MGIIREDGNDRFARKVRNKSKSHAIDRFLTDEQYLEQVEENVL